MKRVLLALVASILLVGCAGPKGPVMSEEGEVIVIDQAYYKECPPLKSLETQTFEAVLDNVIDNAAVYKTCKDQQHNSTLLIKKFTNVKD